eukprot:TRINITY_DN838_c1_g1_i2.p1 TRINITY_DN838_c1_g1~~TRINITY_DN838_c1_g1_i2.p1  ORF type:complete len:1013 (+),score=207.62 TRINITY_DN838_c1_g1_i2:68-3040(+)
MPTAEYQEWKKEANTEMQLWYPPPPTIQSPSRLSAMTRGKVARLDTRLVVSDMDSSIGSCSPVSPVPPASGPVGRRVSPMVQRIDGAEMVKESKFKKIFKNATIGNTLTPTGVHELYNFWVLSYLYESPSPRSTFLFHEWCQSVMCQLQMLPDCVHSARLRVTTCFMILEKMVTHIFPSSPNIPLLKELATAIFVPEEQERDVQEVVSTKFLSKPLFKEQYRLNIDKVQQLEEAFVAKTENLAASLKTEIREAENTEHSVLRFVLRAWRGVAWERKRKTVVHVARLARQHNRFVLLQAFSTWREVHHLTKSDKFQYSQEQSLKHQLGSLSRSTDLTIEGQQYDMACLESERQNLHLELTASRAEIERVQNYHIKEDARKAREEKQKDEAFEGKINDLHDQIEKLQLELAGRTEEKNKAEKSANEMLSHVAHKTSNNKPRPGFDKFCNALLQYGEGEMPEVPYLTVEGEGLVKGGIKECLLSDRIVLHFMRWALDTAQSTRVIDNFTTDLQDGAVFCTVMIHLFPDAFEASNAKIIDARTIIKKMFAVLTTFGAPLSDTPIEDVLGGDSSVNLYICFQIFKTWAATSEVQQSVKIMTDLSDQFKAVLLEDRKWMDLVRHTEEGVIRKYHRGKAAQGELTPLPATLNVSTIVNDAVSRDKLNFTKIRLDRMRVPLSSSPAGSTNPSPVPSPVGTPKSGPLGKKKNSSIKFRISEDEVKETEEVLEGFYKKIKKIHWYYARLTTKTTEMGLDDFMKFMADCSLLCDVVKPPKHSISTQQAEQIFTTVASGVSKNILQLNPQAFVETLVRIAHVKIPPARGLSIADRLKQFLVQSVFPCVMYSNVDEYRDMFSTPQMQEVVNDFKATLLKTFNHYCVVDKASAQTSTMNLKDFWRMLTEAKVTGEALSISAVSLIFSNCQSPSDGAGFDEMVFSEFIEAIAACALCKNPVPVLPPSCRLRDFLIRFYATLSIKSHRLRHNSVVNKRPPTISPKS